MRTTGRFAVALGCLVSLSGCGLGGGSTDTPDVDTQLIEEDGEVVETSNLNIIDVYSEADPNEWGAFAEERESEYFGTSTKYVCAEGVPSTPLQLGAGVSNGGNIVTAIEQDDGSYVISFSRGLFANAVIVNETYIGIVRDIPSSGETHLRVDARGFGGKVNSITLCGPVRGTVIDGPEQPEPTPTSDTEESTHSPDNTEATISPDEVSHDEEADN